MRDELEHVRNYLMIRQMRFKNKFTYTTIDGLGPEGSGVCKSEADAAAACGKRDLSWHGI